MDQAHKTAGAGGEKKKFKVVQAYEGHEVGQTVELTDEEAKTLLEQGKIEAVS